MVASVCTFTYGEVAPYVPTIAAGLGRREEAIHLDQVLDFVRELPANGAHEGAVVGSAHVPCGGLVSHFLYVQILYDYLAVALGNGGRELMYCILADVVDLILCTLLLYEKLRVVSGVALASGECLLLSPEFGVELLKLLCGELQFGAVAGHSRIQKSYVDSNDGLWIGAIRLYIAFGVDLSYEMPLTGIMGHCVAHYLALETDLFRYADTSDVGQLDSIAIPCNLSIVDVKRLLAALLVKLRWSC